jgi:hypothetical protein
MAYAFLKRMNFDGDLGRITLDFKGSSTGTAGHVFKSFTEGKAVVDSTRYPFCFFGDKKSSGPAASMLPYLPFNEDLNRLPLVVSNATFPSLKVTWGDQSKTFSRVELEQGVNLAAEFIPNPFNQVDAAVLAKQTFETQTIKSPLVSHRGLQTNFSQEASTLATIELLNQTISERWLQLNQEVKQSIKPVTHTLTVETVE